MVIIGITGTLGAGKGTIVDYLIHERNFSHFSVRSFLLQRIKKLGLPENRDSMVMVANDLRKDNSPSYIVDELYAEAKARGTNAVIESIRTPGEIESLRKKGRFYLFAVDAEPEIRFERIRLRASETDRVDLKTFLDNEAREMDSDDPNKQNLRRCIDLADFRFENNGIIAMLLEAVEKTVRQIENQEYPGENLRTTTQH
jgi:dephospho-CoA kinase